MDEQRDQSGVTEPSVWSRMTSNVATLFVAAIMVGGIWWWMVGAMQSSPTKTSKSVETTAAKESPRAIATNGNGNGRPHQVQNVGTDSATAVDDPEFDPSRTSWQAPFFASHWESADWEFSPSGMQSISAQSATATFRRRYRKVTVECRIAAVGEPGMFQITLFAAETDATLRAEFSHQLVKLTAKIKGVDSVIKQRRFPVPFAAGKPTTLRFTATGNRVLIICDGKVVLNGSQPAEQSGKPLQLSLRSVGGKFRISDLRLEGE